MSGAGTRVGVGTRFRYDGETVEVVEMAPTVAGNEVVVKDGQGHVRRLTLRELLFSDRAQLIPTAARPGEPTVRPPRRKESAQRSPQHSLPAPTPTSAEIWDSRPRRDPPPASSTKSAAAWMTCLWSEPWPPNPEAARATTLRFYQPGRSVVSRRSSVSAPLTATAGRGRGLGWSSFVSRSNGIGARARLPSVLPILLIGMSEPFARLTHPGSPGAAFRRVFNLPGSVSPGQDSNRADSRSQQRSSAGW